MVNSLRIGFGVFIGWLLIWFETGYPCKRLHVWLETHCMEVYNPNERLCICKTLSRDAHFPPYRALFLSMQHSTPWKHWINIVHADLQGVEIEREAEVRLACSPDTETRLAVHEAKQCRYLIVLFSPQLCPLRSTLDVPADAGLEGLNLLRQEL